MPARRIERSLQLNPNLSRAWYAAGCAQSSRKEYAAAMACFRKALEIHPDWPEAQHNLGRTLFKLGQVEEALDLFRQAAAGGDPALAAGGNCRDHSRKPGKRQPSHTRRAAHLGGAPTAPTADDRTLVTPREDSRSAVACRLRLFFFSGSQLDEAGLGIDQSSRSAAHFEVHLFSDAPASRIQYGYRAHPQDRFHDTTRTLQRSAWPNEIERAEIDLLVDLNGYSTMQRLPLFTCGRPRSSWAGSTCTPLPASELRLPDRRRCGDSAGRRDSSIVKRSCACRAAI